MFPTEIISRIVEAILGDLGKNLIAKSRDSKRQFARNLLAFYDASYDYELECQYLLNILDRDRADNPKEGIRSYVADDAQRTSERMTKSVSKMVGLFSRDLPRSWHDYLDEKPSKEAQRRFTLIEIYGSDLAALMKRAATIDLSMSLMAEILSQQKIDSKGQKILFWDPRTVNAEQLLPLIDWHNVDNRWDNKNYDLERESFTSLFRIIDITDDEEYEAFRQLLLQTIDTIRELKESVGDFIRGNFKIEELL